jgi:hypothetical protein
VVPDPEFEPFSVVFRQTAQNGIQKEDTTMIRNHSRKETTASILALFLAAACTLYPAVAYAQGGAQGGKTTTTTYTDVDRGVNVEVTKDQNGNVIKEKESDLQGKPLGETEREFDKNGKCTKETKRDSRGDKEKETETEYNKDGTIKKQVIRRYYPGGKLRSETILTADKDGVLRGTYKSWDKNGKPSAGGSATDKSQSRIAPGSGNSGLRTVAFGTVHGTIKVNLPDDMAAGDTISGTVIMEPAGRSETERAMNAAALNGYVLEAEPGRRQPLGKMFTFAVPAAMAAVPLVLMNGDDSIEILHVPVKPEVAPMPTSFWSPALVQQGAPVQVSGPFDGDFNNTHVAWDGREGTFLAESPRSLIVEASPDMVGPAQLAIDEGDKHVEGSINVASLQMSASQTTLMKGQETVVTAVVEGLNDLPPSAYPLALGITNWDPTVLKDKSGSSTVVQHIDRKAVDDDGTFQTELVYMGLASGSFTLSGSLDLTNALSVPLR